MSQMEKIKFLSEIEAPALYIDGQEVTIANVPINAGAGEHSITQKTDAGKENSAAGKNAAAFGANSKADADYAFAAGSWAAARKQASFAANAGDASGEFAAAFGDSYAEVDRAFAKGFETHAKAYASETGGIESVVEVTGTAAVADGKGGVAAGPYSAVHNLECKTGENAKAAYAGGEYSEANHEGSFVHGIGLKTGANYQSVFGKYNAEDSDALFAVGCGSGDNNRRTMFKINSSEARLGGNFYAANLYADGGIYSDNGVSASGFYIKGTQNPNLFENTVYCADNSGNGKIFANKFIARQWNWSGGGWKDAELTYSDIVKLKSPQVEYGSDDLSENGYYLRSGQSGHYTFMYEDKYDNLYETSSVGINRSVTLKIVVIPSNGTFVEINGVSLPLNPSSGKYVAALGNNTWLAFTPVQGDAGSFYVTIHLTTSEGQYLGERKKFNVMYRLL